MVLFLDLWLIYLKTSLPFGIAQGLVQELVFINNLTETRPSVKNYLASKHICERWKFRLIEVEKSKPKKGGGEALLSLSFWTVSNKQTTKKTLWALASLACIFFSSCRCHVTISFKLLPPWLSYFELWTKMNHLFLKVFLPGHLTTEIGNGAKRASKPEFWFSHQNFSYFPLAVEGDRLNYNALFFSVWFETD